MRHSPLPKSAILTVIFSCASYTLPAPSTDIALDERGVSAALIGSSAFALYGGGCVGVTSGARPPTPGACCDNSDGPACFALPGSGRVFSPNGDESSVTFDIRSAACSIESDRGAAASLLPLPLDRRSGPTSSVLPNEPGLLAASPSILLIPNAHRSRCEDEPKDEDGEGSGCEPVMKTDSERGVWFPPRPREGGTPTRRVGGGVWDADCAASSAWITDSTSSMQIRTFSGLRSAVHARSSDLDRQRVYATSPPLALLTSVDHAATPVHVVEPEEDLFGYLLDEVHGHALVLVPLDQAQQVLA